MESRAERIARELQDLPDAERRKVAFDLLERLGMLAPAGSPSSGWWGRLRYIGVVVGLLVGVGLWYQSHHATGRLELTTVPADATVAVDGRAVGDHSPHALKLKTGRHKVSVTRAGYTPSDRSIFIADDRAERETVKLLVSDETGFEIVSDPPGLPVFLDGTLVNGPYGPARSNFRARRIEPGPHVIELKGSDRFLPWRGEVEVEPDRIVRVTAILEPAPR